MTFWQTQLLELLAQTTSYYYHRAASFTQTAPPPPRSGSDSRDPNSKNSYELLNASDEETPLQTSLALPVLGDISWPAQLKFLYLDLLR